jgi:4'-phosphopantetheinyl transferase
LSFNLSNSGELVLIAAGGGRAVGMDVEKLRPLPDLLNIARRFFSPGEVRDILALSEDKRNEAFFAVWTRKEAFLKATGVGLAFPLAEFSVSVDPDAAAKLAEIRGDEGIARGWFLTDVFPGQGYRAALASPGDPCRVDHWIFEPATHSRCI